MPPESVFGMPLATEVANEASLPCPAWVWSELSNVHVAKDRSWFGDDYTPFQSFLEDSLFKVVGVGTVDLPVKLGPDSHDILRLHNVLHVPDMICNIVGDLMTMEGYEMLENKFVSQWTNQTVARLTVDHGLWMVVLSEPHGPRVGPSPFDKSTCYSLSGATWPETERLRFDARTQPRRVLKFQPVPKSPTSDEQVWLEQNRALIHRACNLRRGISKRKTRDSTSSKFHE